MSRGSHNHADSAGFSIVELTISIALTAIVLAAAMMTWNTGNQSSEALLSDIGAEETIRDVLQGMSSDLRYSSRVGEDTNNNDIFDLGEDTNANGRFEDDFAITATSIKFNVLRSDAGYSLPTEYRLVGTELRRLNQADVTGKQSVTVLARDVAAFTITQSGSGITISLTVRARTRTGSVTTRTRSVSISPRN